MRKLIAYFDLNRDAKLLLEPASVSAPLHVVPQWISLVFGILVQPQFESFRETGIWRFDMGAFSAWFLFSFIVAIIIFPAVYRSTYDASKPICLPLCSIFASGLGWQALMQTMASAAISS